MGRKFISAELLENNLASVDNSMLKATGLVWHKSDIKNNCILITGIDTDIRWGID